MPHGNWLPGRLRGVAVVYLCYETPVAGAPSATALEDERTALGKDTLKRAFLDSLFYMQGKFLALATKRDYYLALAYVVRDRLLQRWVSTAAEYTKQRSRTVAQPCI